MHKKAKVTLVGAGPGDPDLITVKGLKAIQNADVILCDSLANDELLKNAPDHCQCINVGKRSGQRSFRQEDINLLIVQNALQFGHVVRLKGGDPFVFGRGHEELEYVRNFEIEVEIIPGISSSIAVPASQHIPVTRRGVNDSFWVITATKSHGELSEDIQLASQSTATVIILMGVRKLPQIASIYQSSDKGNVPAMIIQNGTLPNEKYAISTIANLPVMAKQPEIKSPAVIIVGAVVALHKEAEFWQMINSELKAFGQS